MLGMQAFFHKIKTYKTQIVWAFMLIAFLVEFIILISCNNHNDQSTTSVWLFICSMSLGILPIIFNKSLKKNTSSTKPSSWWFFALFTSIVVLCIYFFKMQDLIKHCRIDEHVSDIIPTIMQEVHRFLHHEFVYTPILLDGYSYPSGYLPAVWFPFIAAETFHFDYRYIPFAIFALLMIGILLVYKKQISSLSTFLSLVMIPLSLELFIANNNSVPRFSVEVLIACYYVFLCLAITTKNYFLIGIAISLCLLSRYSLALWLPLYFIVLLINQDKKRLFKIIMVIIIAIALFYVIPFLSKEPSLVIRGLLNYSSAGDGEWRRINQSTHLPEHLTHGLGFAYFFYVLKGIDIPTKIKYLQIVLLALIAIFLVSMSFIFYKYKNKLSTPIFLICSLKIYLSIFYTFIHIPYVYLYTVPLMVSSSLIFYLASAKKEDLID